MHVTSLSDKTQTLWIAILRYIIMLLCQENITFIDNNSNNNHNHSHHNNYNHNNNNNISPELQVFYRVGENSDTNLFTRVEQYDKSSFLVKRFYSESSQTPRKLQVRLSLLECVHLYCLEYANIIFSLKYRYYFKSFSVDLNESVWDRSFP